ncbi:MAG: energy-coupling factor transporter transmembrane component T family protein [Christensenellales bacterium]
MFKDMTLGSYFPGDSYIHKLDPRTKILLTLAFMIIVFLVKTGWGYLMLGCFFLTVAFISGIPLLFYLKSLKPLMFILIFTVIINVFFTTGETPLFKLAFITVYPEGLNQAFFMGMRLVFLIVGATVMTLTTSPIELTDGLERLLSPLAALKFPAHEMSMMMTIALRFIPTLIEETDKIMKAQKARGADFESGNIMARAKAMVPLMVPLFVSAFRRADDLAMAMEARCYRGGDGRTRLHVLKMRMRDGVAAICMVALGAAIVLLG